VCARALC